MLKSNKDHIVIHWKVLHCIMFYTSKERLLLNVGIVVLLETHRFRGVNLRAPATECGRSMWQTQFAYRRRHT